MPNLQTSLPGFKTLKALMQSLSISNAPPSPRGLSWDRKRRCSISSKNDLPVKKITQSLPPENISDWDAIYKGMSQEFEGIPHEPGTDTLKKLTLSNNFAKILCNENAIKSLSKSSNYDPCKLRVELKKLLVARGWSKTHVANKSIITLSMIRLNMKRLGEAGWVQTLEYCDSEALERLIKYFGGKAVGDPSIGEITWEAKIVATALVDDITAILQIVSAL